jgi:hypothetical protein
MKGITENMCVKEERRLSDYRHHGEYAGKGITEYLNKGIMDNM